ncbi:MAG: hypothetical protein J0I93_03045 [Legionella sp.]|nr:hypothetical protein [Legionella sp.]
MTETPSESYHEYSDESPQAEYKLDDESLLKAIDELNQFAETEIVVEEENLYDEIELIEHNLREFMEQASEERAVFILEPELPEIAAQSNEAIMTDALKPDADEVTPTEQEYEEVTFATFIRRNSITADITDREDFEKASTKKQDAAFKRLIASYKSDAPEVFITNCDKFVNEHGFDSLKNYLNRLLRHDHTTKRGLINETLGGAIKTLNSYVVENTAKAFTAILDQGTGNYAEFLADKLNNPSTTVMNKLLRQYPDLSDVHNESAYVKARDAIEKAAHRAMSHIETNDKLPTELHQNQIQKNLQAELQALDFIEEARKIAVKDEGKEARECIKNTIEDEIEAQINNLENSKDPDKNIKIDALREEMATKQAAVDTLKGSFLDYYLEKVRFSSLKSGYIKASSEAGKDQQMISSYVIGDIINSKLVEKRTLTLERYIRVAENLIDKNQLDGALAIYSALNSTAVSKLETTWGGLSQHSQAAWQKMGELFSFSGNYKNLRQHVAQLNANNSIPPAYLPPLVIAKDLTGLLENLPLTNIIKMNENKVTDELTKHRVINLVKSNANNTLATVNQRPEANQDITQEMARYVEQKTLFVHKKNAAETLSAPKREVLVDEHDEKTAKRRESLSNHSSKVMARAGIFMDEKLYEQRTPKAYKEHLNQLADAIKTETDEVKKLMPVEKIFQRFEKITQKIEKICTKIVDKVGQFFDSIFHKSSHHKSPQKVEMTEVDSKKSLLKQADDAKGKPFNCDKDQCPTTQNYKKQLSENNSKQELNEEEIVSTPRMRS